MMKPGLIVTQQLQSQIQIELLDNFRGMDLEWCSEFGYHLGKRARSSTSSDTGEPEPLDVMVGDRLAVLIEGSIRYGIVKAWKGASTNLFEGFHVSVIWEGKVHPEVTLLRRNNFLVLDRMFSVGQKVCFDDKCGTVVSCRDSVALQIYNTNKLILSDSPVSSLEPLTKLFHGVFIEYMGWFGSIAEVVRRVNIEFDPEHICHVLRREPVIMRAPKLPIRKRDTKSKSLLNRTYPFILSRYIPSNSVPVNGSRIVIAGKHLKQVTEKFPEFVPQNTMLSGTVLRSDVVGIAVDWFTPIPGLPVTPKPKMSLDKEDEIAKVRHFYIHPCRHFFKDGLCEYELKPNDDIIHMDELEQKLAYCLERGNTTEISPIKRPRIESTTARDPVKILVRKYIVRHQFDVQFDGTEEIRTIYGSDLQPWFGECEKEKKFQPPYFVRRKNSDAANIYGVILRQYTAYSSGGEQKGLVSVQWLEANYGSVVPLQINEENCLDVTLHDEFNELLVGTHVARAQNSDIPDAQENGFQFGTVLAIDRYNLGRLNVYCSVDQVEKHLWPFQLQRIKYEKPDAGINRVAKKFLWPDDVDSPKKVRRGKSGRSSPIDPYKEDQAYIMKSLELGCHDFSDPELTSDSEDENDEEDYSKTPISELARAAAEAAKAYLSHVGNTCEPIDRFDG